MSSDQDIRIALEFPEGIFIFPDRGGIYFMPDVDSDKAYLGWGEKKDLHGKIAHNLPTRSDKFKNYDVTYEIEDGSLLAARLITPFSRSAGKLLDEEDVKTIGARLKDGSLTLVRISEAPKVIRAARAGDGTTVVLVQSYKGPEGSLERTLYGGTADDLKPLSNCYSQGGNSFYFNLPDGTEVALPYGFGAPTPNEPPTFGGKLMAYLDIEDDKDPAAFGIKMDVPEPHLDPFCPELYRHPEP